MVLAVLATLAALITPYVFDMMEKAKISKIAETYRTLAKGLNDLKTDRVFQNADPATIWPAVDALFLSNQGYISRDLNLTDNPFGGSASIVTIESAGDNWTLISGGPALDGPYSIFELNPIPQEVAKKIKLAIDGVLGGDEETTGKVQYADADSTTVKIFLLDLDGK